MSNLIDTAGALQFYISATENFIMAHNSQCKELYLNNHFLCYWMAKRDSAMPWQENMQFSNAKIHFKV